MARTHPTLGLVPPGGVGAGGGGGGGGRQEQLGNAVAGAGEMLAPALGNTWAHCVNVRLLVSAVEAGAGGGGRRGYEL